MSPTVARAARPSREVGVVLAITPSGHLTARALGREFPSEGTPVTDRTGRLRGRVSRVFGPVDRPYLSIRLPGPPRPTEGAALVGSALLRDRGLQNGQR